MNLFKKWVLPQAALFFLIYGVVWAFAEPIGFPTGYSLFMRIVAIAIGIQVIVIPIRLCIEYYKRIKELELAIGEKEKEIAKLKPLKSYCCIARQETPTCPLGVNSIHKNTKDTIVPSLKEAKKSFKWLGLSAFNVVHNNKEIFYSKKGVKFEFNIVDPTNNKLSDLNNSYYNDKSGRMSSAKLIHESAELIESIKKEINPNIEVKYHNQLPTFRIILVDDRKAFVSFYEKGKDALESLQIELEDTENGLFKWFEAFYDKILLTEKIIQPKI